MKCTEPPVRWPRSPDRPKHSAMTPWPAKAASPEIKSGIAQVRSSGVAPSWSCLARVLPSTTGLTISRCDGLAVSERWTLLPSNSRSDDAPRWYLTSREPAGACGGARAALELVEDGAVRLRQHMGEHVEAAAMRHAQRDVLHAQRAAAL